MFNWMFDYLSFGAKWVVWFIVCIAGVCMMFIVFGVVAILVDLIRMIKRY